MDGRTFRKLSAGEINGRKKQGDHSVALGLPVSENVARVKAYTDPRQDDQPSKDSDQD
jgi:hypothetical protein